MTWLLKLYPPRWRRRYGRELEELVASRPFSLGAAIDLIAGAIDAWLNPQLTAAATANVKGDVPMIARTMQLKCAGYGPNVTAIDKVKSTTVTIGGTLVLALLWIWSVWQFGQNAYVTALSPMAYFLPTLIGLRWTSLKGRSARTQTIFIGGLSAVLVAFFLIVVWINRQI